MYAAKLVHNTNNFNSVSVVAQIGIWVNTNNRKPYYFGLEEWINNPLLKKMKVGYLDCYRANNYIGTVQRIILFSFNPVNKKIYHCGNIFGVEQLANNEIQELRNTLNQNNWSNTIESNFNDMGDLRTFQNHNQYLQCYNSQIIVANTGRSFALNIKYKKIEFFEPQQRINLTQINGGINNSWKRLSVRYTVPINWIQFF